MAEFGHQYSNANGMHIDGWGEGPFVLLTSAGRFVFEDSRRFGPCLVDTRTGDPTGEIIPEGSPFWPAWEKWRDEGRRTQPGKPLGKRSNRIEPMYCVYTRRTRKPKRSGDAAP